MLLPSSSESRQSIKLVLSDVMQNLRVEILEPRTSAGTPRLEQKSSGETVTWTLHLERPIPAGEAVRLRFAYDGGAQTRFVFYIGAEGSFAGGNSTAWYPQIERDARAVGTLRFSVPAGYTVFAPVKEIGAGNSDAPQSSARARFNFTIGRPSYFSFAAGRYTVERGRGSKGIQTSAYLLRPRPRIGDFLDNCVRVLEALTREFGANPYGEFALVEVPTEQAGRARFEGASGEGFIFSNGNFLDADFNVAYYGHEIAHQWWGVAIGRKWWESSRGRLMLDEAMAQFGSLRAVEEIEGASAAERYRRTGYPGYIDFHSADGYFMVEAGGFDHKLSELPDGEVSRINALEQETAPDLYGARFTLELGLGQLLLAQNKFAEARKHLEAAIASPSRRANVLPWAYFYLARVAKELNDEELLRRAVNDAITADANVGGRTGVSRQARALLNR